MPHTSSCIEEVLTKHSKYRGADKIQLLFDCVTKTINANARTKPGLTHYPCPRVSTQAASSLRTLSPPMPNRIVFWGSRHPKVYPDITSVFDTQQWQYRQRREVYLSLPGISSWMAKRAPPLLSSRHEQFYRHYCVPVAVALAI